MNPFRLYELSVTNPIPLARFLRAVHAKNPRVLREDFSGTAALARGWLALDPAYRALAIDLDSSVLARIPRTPRLVKRRANALTARDKADIIAATNFPVGYCHTRPELLRYFTNARRSLHARGIFVCDIYGGRSAFTTGTTRRRVIPPRGQPFEQLWEQRTANPATGLVTNAIHFRQRTTRGVRTLRNAFVYHWRLWSIPELKDALLDAGFSCVEVYDRLADALDHLGHAYVRPFASGDQLDDEYVVYLAARREPHPSTRGAVFQPARGARPSGPTRGKDARSTRTEAV